MGYVDKIPFAEVWTCIIALRPVETAVILGRDDHPCFWFVDLKCFCKTCGVFYSRARSMPPCVSGKLKPLETRCASENSAVQKEEESTDLGSGSSPGDLGKYDGLLQVSRFFVMAYVQKLGKSTPTTRTAFTVSRMSECASVTQTAAPQIRPWFAGQRYSTPPRSADRPARSGRATSSGPP